MHWHPMQRDYMQDEQFSDDFCTFLQANVPSVEAAELLLLFERNRDVQWTTADAAKAVGGTLSQQDASRYIDQFSARGLVQLTADRRVRYRPASEEGETMVRTLAQAYRERPVTLIRVIYALRDSKVKSFADAFRLRKD
jgi:hypothetical protein